MPNGAVRYRVTAPAVSTSNCHCTMCQKGAGAAFVSWMTFPMDSFLVTKGNLKLFKSSEKGERGFCDTCGSALTFTLEDISGLIDITTATADDPTAWPPTHHIWTSTRIPWLHANEDLPSYDSRAPRD
jgi:hypothetical protein